MGFASTHVFIFTDSEGSHGTGIGSAPASTGYSVIVYWILNNWVDDCVRKHGIICRSLQSRQLVHMNAMFVRATLVSLLLVRKKSVNLLTLVNLLLEPLFFDEFCESTARTHDFE